MKYNKFTKDLSVALIDMTARDGMLTVYDGRFIKSFQFEGYKLHISNDDIIELYEVYNNTTKHRLFTIKINDPEQSVAALLCLAYEKRNETMFKTEFFEFRQQSLLDFSNSILN